MTSRDEYVGVVKSTAQNLATKLVMARLVVAQPWIAHPIVYAIVETIVDEMFEELIEKTEFGAFFLFIDFRTNKQGRAFFDAAVRNVKAKLGTDEKEKADAQKALIEAFNNFASWTT